MVFWCLKDATDWSNDDIFWPMEVFWSSKDGIWLKKPWWGVLVVGHGCPYDVVFCCSWVKFTWSTDDNGSPAINDAFCGEGFSWDSTVFDCSVEKFWGCKGNDCTTFVILYCGVESVLGTAVPCTPAVLEGVGICSSWELFSGAVVDVCPEELVWEIKDARCSFELLWDCKLACCWFPVELFSEATLNVSRDAIWLCVARVVLLVSSTSVAGWYRHCWSTCEATSGDRAVTDSLVDASNAFDTVESDCRAVKTWCAVVVGCSV